MVGESDVLGDAAASWSGGGAAAHEGAAEVVGGSNSGSDIERGSRVIERRLGGNRWPRQETLALLEIRSDMDVAFRDATFKGPLWEQVSMKLAELGYHRSAKKCKEKFENVYKYHKRTKDCRVGKSDAKSYRFFDQLEALDHHHIHNHNNQPSTTDIAAPMSMPPVLPNVTLPSSTTSSLPIPNNTTPIPQQLINVTIPTTTNFPPSASTPNPTTTNIPTDLLSNSSFSSTSSDQTLEGIRNRKRIWKDFFERLMKEVIQKQEDLQRKFLEAIEKREHERLVREEEWRTHQMQRINKEKEILAQERSIAAAKDAALMSLLQKIAEQQNIPETLLSNITNILQQQPPPPNVAQSSPLPPSQAVQPVVVPQLQQQILSSTRTNMEIVKADDNMMGARWPKVEVNALIKLRTSMDVKYQENGPKGPLWEEISTGMRKLGYNRNAKRCKEKWENINKYFKKVKESNKRRPEDSKTCPYFHQLDALYREKKINTNAAGVVVSNSKVENENTQQQVAPVMVRPEQQWPPQQREEEQQQRGEEDDMDEGGVSGSGSGGSNFEIVASKPAGVLGAASAADH